MSPLNQRQRRFSVPKYPLLNSLISSFLFTEANTYARNDAQEVAHTKFVVSISRKEFGEDISDDANADTNHDAKEDFFGYLVDDKANHNATRDAKNSTAYTASNIEEE